MSFGLVLGAGGVVGMNYHAGVLHALVEAGGIDPSRAELMVGTSAGSVVASLLRTGWSPAGCFSFAVGEHPLVAELDEAERDRRRAAAFSPRFTSPVDLARRTLGSSWVVARSVFRAPAPPLPGRVARALGRRFPGGIFDHAAQDRLAEVLPEEWPDRPLWLVAVDLGSGRRVVLGRKGSPPVSLHEAVLASCAIPGVYPPVRAGGLTLVDGGAHSSTHLDLAAKAACDVILGVAPMAWDPAGRPASSLVLGRRMAARSLAAEARAARAAGATVLLVRPSPAELSLHGRRLMRPTDGAAIARAAYDAAARLLETPRFTEALASLAA